MNSILKIALIIIFLLTAGTFAAAQTDGGAMSKDGVIKTVRFMKQTNSSDAEIAEVISRAGVDFKPSAADEQELRQAGASDAVINAVRGSNQGPAQTDDAAKIDNPPARNDKAPKTDAAKKQGDRPQNKNPNQVTFQVGDRVEVNVTQMMPPNTKWYQATVVKVNTNPLGDVLDYDVKLDTTDGSEVIRDHIPKRPNWIRPPQ